MEYQCRQDPEYVYLPSSSSLHLSYLYYPLVNEDCWLGINGLPSSQSGPTYRTAVANFVHLFLQNNIYVILDLHWTANGVLLFYSLSSVLSSLLLLIFSFRW